MTNWLTPDASANPTILDAQGAGRVVYITGPIQVNLDGLSLWNGLAKNGNGGGVYHNAILNEMGSGIYHLSVLTISNSIIANSTAVGAFPNGFGGGIASAEGQLHLQNSIITGNHAVLGGGILNFLGKITIENSNLISNTATEAGGGIILGYGVLTMTHSTVALNHAELDGGGIENDVESVVTLINSTVSGNTAVRNGGGLDNFNNAQASLINTTFSHNSAESNGGGIYNSSTVTLNNSLIANSSGGDCWHLGSEDSLIDSGFNLIEDGSCGFAVSSDPQLGPLADNGGSSWTHALLPGSPALDAGNCADGRIITDQRGILRPQGDACDIGAYERAWPTQFLPFILNQMEQ